MLSKRIVKLNLALARNSNNDLSCNLVPMRPVILDFVKINQRFLKNQDNYYGDCFSNDSVENIFL